MNTVINGYRLTRELSNENAGMCQWGFAEKDGFEFFIKQFLKPKYPADDCGLSPKMIQRLRSSAEEAFERRKLFYDRLRECRTGNNVVVEDFFRFGSFYYAVSDRVRGPYLSLEQIAALPEEKKLVLIRAILFNVMQFHEKGIVHSDLKPDNIMVRSTAAGFCTAKIIDFDSGFFSCEPPEEIVGDQVYFSPEVMLHNMGRDAAVTEKSDLFALGLLFHLYWTGTLPGFDRRQHRYAGEALLEGGRLSLAAMPGRLRDLLEGLLSLDPAERPSARQAWESLSEDTMRSLQAQLRLPGDDDL